MKEKYPPPTRRDHLTFCETEGWTSARTATGKSGTHHLTYLLHLDSGEILRTRISHPPGRETYGKSMWSHILRVQLRVTEQEFWQCVRHGHGPQRGRQPMAPSVPAGVVHRLLTVFHVPESDLAGMSADEAIALLATLQTPPLD